ncbi:MAG: hypothetical protein CM15mV9_2500 [uncultured marine virus]|nr:MAG: hypothetical protein CM15mV9_2500 [uncultured marine virus]
MLSGSLIFKTTAQGAVGSSERLRITSAGKVGINDNNPSADLSVKPTAAHCSAQVISGDGSTILNGTAVQGSEGRFGMNSNHPLAIYTNGNERLRIDSSGRLLLGTNANRTTNSHTPALQISGDNYSETTVQIINNANASHGAYLFMGKQRSGSLVVILLQ